MAYLALYRKYRPTNFDEMAGQKEIITVIKNAIENDKVSHAYLFSGPRGTGKTTTAKIIAKMVNCENLHDGNLCGKCFSCLSNENNDVIEIDAASNNGVDEIREIRDKANLVPTNSKYKIYIIDEVHMLTTQAFNALLKTLEEPPSHVIFILATTEYYKIPLTIISRCQKFQFNKINEDEMVKRLKYISEKEKISISEEALYEISKISDGAMRDAINLLDQVVSYKDGKIEINDIYKICEIISSDEIVDFLIQIKSKNNKYLINKISDLNERGYSLNKFLEEIIYFLKDVLIYKYTNDVKTNVDNVKKVNDIYDENELNELIVNLNDMLERIKTTNYPSIILTVEFLKITNINDKNKEENVNQQEEDISIKNINEKKVNEQLNDYQMKNGNNNRINIINGLSEDNKFIRINNTFAEADKNVLNNIKELWKKIADYVIDDDYGFLAGILNDSVPCVSSYNYLILMSNYDSTVKRINEKYEQVEKFLKIVLKSEYKVVCLTQNEWQEEKNKYILNIKKGKKYFIIKEKNDDDVNKNEDNNSDLDQLIDLVGEENIEFK